MKQKISSGKLTASIHGAESIHAESIHKEHYLAIRLSPMSKPKHILADFSSIRFGGGVQLSLNFLKNLHETDFAKFKVSALLPGDGELAAFQFGPSSSGAVFHAPVGLWQRLWYSHGLLQKQMKSEQIDAIFTFFGPGVPHPDHIPSLVSIAYPIICYPDSPFWKHVDFKLKMRQTLINSARCRRLRQGTRLLAETDVMKNRLAKQLGCPADLLNVIPPAVSGFLPDRPGTPEQPCQRFLFLSGLATHKNLWQLYDIAALGHQQGLDFTFVLTSQEEAWRQKVRTTAPIKQEIIDQHFEFRGAVPSEQIGELYASCDALIILSDLESFSNNYMESWKSGLPLLCSDRDFARHICGDSAVYVEPHDPASVVQGMKSLIEDSSLRSKLVTNGKERLGQLPTFSERYNRIAGILQQMLEQG